MLSAAAVLTGCGRAPDEPAPAGPLVIDHQYGSTTIAARPQRVVTMTGTWTDALIALGVPITAEYVLRGYAGNGNRFAWTPPHQSTVVEMADTTDVQLERLAGFAPDLILAGYIGNQERYGQLGRVAPTIPVMDKSAVLDTWQQVTTTAGRIFGHDDMASSLVAEAEQQVAAVKTEFPAATGKTFVFGQLTVDGQFGLVADKSDPAAKFISATGPTLSPALESVANGGARVLVSLERTDLLAADLVIMWPLVGGPDHLALIPGWSSLPAVRKGATVVLDNDSAMGLGSPTIYSVPYVLDLLRPALRAMGA